MQLPKHVVVFALAGLPAVIADYCVHNGCYAAASKHRLSCSAFQRTTVAPSVSTIYTTIKPTITITGTVPSTTTVYSTLGPESLSTVTYSTTTVDTTVTLVVPSDTVLTSEFSGTTTTVTTSTSTSFTTTDLATETTTVGALLLKRGNQSTQILLQILPSPVPLYANAVCYGHAEYASACSCIGIGPTTVTQRCYTTTSTVTQPHTITVTAGKPHTTTKVVTSPTTNVKSVVYTTASTVTSFSTSVATSTETDTTIISTETDTSSVVISTATTSSTTTTVNACPTSNTQSFYLAMNSGDGTYNNVFIGAADNNAGSDVPIADLADLVAAGRSNTSPTLWTIDPVTGILSDTLGRVWESSSNAGFSGVYLYNLANAELDEYAIFNCASAPDTTGNCAITCTIPSQPGYDAFGYCIDEVTDDGESFDESGLKFGPFAEAASGCTQVTLNVMFSTS